MLLLVAACGGVAAQSQLRGSGGPPTLLGSDMAVLEARETRKDLPCTVTPVKPELGFDLRFHAGYEISLPLKELAGPENLLTILFRVTSDKAKDEPVYFSQKVKVPDIEENARGEAYLQGTFDVGEGNYQIDWLMRDRAERVCASFWEHEAALPARDRTLELTMRPGTVAESVAEPFTNETLLPRDTTAEPLTVKILVNFAPQNPHASSLQAPDLAALVSILRTLEREPRLTRFSIVAFNLQRETVVYRQDPSDHIDLPAIGEALKSLQLGRVEISRLKQKNSETTFLGELIQQEFKPASGAARPDALIFAGPKAMLDSNVPAETLREAGGADVPVFYLNYALQPERTPWTDTIGHAVRYFKGQEYTISRPRDLWFAITEMVGRIAKLKSARRPMPDATARGSHEVAVP
jgi:hypothetical protein